MTVYYKSKELIIVHHLLPTKKADEPTIQTRIIMMVGGRINTIYDAHEIWFYNPITHIFISHKNKSGTSLLLKSFLTDKGINIKSDVISIGAVRILRYHFIDHKDLFLFNLKFGN